MLYINDDLGKDFLLGLKKGLGDRAKTMIVREVSNELTDPSVDSQIIDLKGSGADALVQFTTSKFAAQGIRKAYDLGWRPRVHILASVAAAIGGTLIPAGVERSKGVITARWEKHPTDPTTVGDADVVEYLAFAKKYMPNLNIEDNTAVPGYINSVMISRVLRACGDELTRENVLKQATSLKDAVAPMLLPGITLTNTPDDYLAFHAMQLAQFDGAKFVPLGESSASIPRRKPERWERATPWRSCSSGPRASRSLKLMSERDARGPEEHEERRHGVARSQQVKASGRPSGPMPSSGRWRRHRPAGRCR